MTHPEKPKAYSGKKNPGTTSTKSAPKATAKGAAPKAPTRLLAAQALELVLAKKGRALDDVLAQLEWRAQELGISELARRDRAYVAALTHASLRHYQRYQRYLASKLRVPPPAKVSLLLVIALADLHALATPAHAAVDQAVLAIQDWQLPKFTGLVNAVLRGFLRERESDPELHKRLTAEAERELPGWLRQRLQQQYSEGFSELARALLEPAPMWLRVAPEFHANYAERLTADGISYTESFPGAPYSLCLQQPCPVSELLGFEQGQVSVQDAGAQLAAHFLAPQAGESVLDACAAPGGKTLHLLQYTSATDAPSIQVTAVDCDSERLASVAQNLARAGLSAELLAGDAAELFARAELSTRRFDAILLDAPCSATGVIRRHPDILVLRRLSDLEPLIQTQKRLLSALWSRLKPGGRLLYVTCSLLAEENDEVIAAFLHSNRLDPEQLLARVESLDTTVGLKTRFGLQLLPRPHADDASPGSDGFYYCLLSSSNAERDRPRVNSGTL